MSPSGSRLLLVFMTIGLVGTGLLVTPSVSASHAVTSIAPNTGPVGGGTNILITGSGFIAGSTVSIGGTAATGVVVNSATEIVAVTPAKAAGTYNVVVTLPDTTTYTFANGFTYSALPTITTVTPATGSTSGGTAITLAGTNFRTGATVSIGGTAATGVVVNSATEVVATTPAKAVGTYNVVLTNSDGSSYTKANGFTYVTATNPTIATVSPAIAGTAGGTVMALTGTGFASGATVSVGGTAGTSVVVADSQNLQFIAPAKAAGTYNVVVTNADGGSATKLNGLTYQAPPTVTAISPASGTIAGGTVLTVTGTSFLAGVSVTFDGTPATTLTRVSTTKLTVTTPAHVAGAVDVQVCNTDAQCVTSNLFSYGLPGEQGYVPPPVTTVASTSADSGKFSDVGVSPDGQTVVIAHTTGAGNALTFSVSQDGGATFAPVQIPAGFTSSSAKNVVVLDHDSWAVAGSIGGGACSSHCVVWTKDGGLNYLSFGFSWTSTGGQTNAVSWNPPELKALPGGGYIAAGTYYCPNANFCNAPLRMEVRLVKTTDETTWAGTGGLLTTQSIPQYTSVALVPSSQTAWALWISQANVLVGLQTTNSGTSYTNLVGVSSVVNDPFTPLSSYGYSVVAGTTLDYVAFLDSSNRPYIGKRDQSGQYLFTRVSESGVYNGQLAAAGSGPDNFAIAYMLDTASQFVVVYTNNGVNFQATAPVTPGTTLATKYFPGFAFACPSYHTSYQLVATQVLNAKTVPVGDCGTGGGGSQTVTAAATATVTGLVGFDVDPAGSTAIARTDGGQFVRVYPAGPLTSPANKDTDCTSVGGVATMGNHVAYFDCDGSGNVVQLEIRSPSLTSPSKPSLCSDSGFCVEDIETECGVIASCIAGDQDDDTHLAIVEELPIDYSRYEDGNAAEVDYVHMALAFADASGKLGVWTYSMENNGVDYSNIVSVGIASQSPDTLCVHLDPNGKTYLYGSSTQSNVQGFEVTFDFQGTLLLGNRQVVPVMTNVFPGTASTAGALGVACGDGKFAIANLNKVTVWNRTAGSGLSSAPHITITTPEADPVRQVAMSSDGNWVAYSTATKWYVINANVPVESGSDATVECTGDVPAGPSQKGMQLHGSGSALWIATTTTISRYETFGCTTGTDVVFNPPCADPNDVDCDGVRNSVDPDIDGDGLANSADPDDDGDGILDGVDNTPGGGGTGTEEEDLDFGDSIFAGLIDGGTVLTGSVVGGRIFATIILVLGFAATGAGALSRPAAKNAIGDDGWVWGLGFGAALGFLLAIATEVFPKTWAFIGVILALLSAAAYWAYGRK
jgi:hypothetical protein